MLTVEQILDGFRPEHKCPFCEGNNLTWQEVGDSGFYFTKCLDCQATGPNCDSVRLCIERFVFPAGVFKDGQILKD